MNLSLRFGRYIIAIGFFTLLATGSVAAPEKSAVSVTAVKLSSIVSYPKHKAPAVVVAKNDSNISAQVTAQIDKIAVKVGQVVKKGAVLVQLHSDDYVLILQREQAALKSFESRIEFARYQLQRAQTLSKQQAVADELLKQRETDLAVLLAEQVAQQAAFDQAKLNLEKCTIRAPFKAVVVEKFAQVGELAAPGTPLLRIVDALHSEVSAKLPTAKVELLGEAQQFKYITDTHSYELKLRAITPSVDPIERTQEIRLVFVNDRALSGSSGQLLWLDNHAHLPAEYLIRRKGLLGVFIEKGGQAEFVALPDSAEGRPARVSLPPTARVIDKGRFRLQHGDPVKVKEPLNTSGRADHEN